MPLPENRVQGGYRGVEIRTTEKLGFPVVVMSHNKHRFSTMEEAKAFVDEAIKASERHWSEVVRRAA